MAPGGTATRSAITSADVPLSVGTVSRAPKALEISADKSAVREDNSPSATAVARGNEAGLIGE